MTEKDFAKDQKALGDRWHDHIFKYGTSVSFEKCEEWRKIMDECYIYAQKEYENNPT